jgi:hypothetical protein
MRRSVVQGKRGRKGSGLAPAEVERKPLEPDRSLEVQGIVRSELAKQCALELGSRIESEMQVRESQQKVEAGGWVRWRGFRAGQDPKTEKGTFPDNMPDGMNEALRLVLVRTLQHPEMTQMSQRTMERKIDELLRLVEAQMPAQARSEYYSLTPPTGPQHCALHVQSQTNRQYQARTLSAPLPLQSEVNTGPFRTPQNEQSPHGARRCARRSREYVFALARARF